MQSIYTAASGLKNMQARLDTIAANIANVNTTGYKSKRLDFKDALYKALEVPEDPNSPETLAAEAAAAAAKQEGTEAGTEEGTAEEAGAGAANAATVNAQTAADETAAAEKIYVLIGSGVIISSTTTDFTDGPMVTTSEPTDLAISCRGFFTLMSAKGEILYTRNGNFSISSDGYLVNSEGFFVLDSNDNKIQTYDQGRQLSVNSEGIMRLPGGEIGKIGIADFSNPDGLEAVGGTCYRTTAVSGQAFAAEKAIVQQGCLENSNVNLANDMTMLLRSQRAFSLVSKALQTADDMEGLANTIHR